MKKGECVTECSGQWLQAANNLLKRNEIPVRDFVQAIYLLLEKDRGKYRNLYILSPLKVIYKTSNPATDTFVWIEAEQSPSL